MINSISSTSPKFDTLYYEEDIHSTAIHFLALLCAA